MNTRTIFIALLALIILGIIAFVLLDDRDEDVVEEPLTFEECAARYPVMESNPRRCVSPSGREFVEEAPAEPAPTVTNPPAQQPGIANLITVSSPSSGQRITSPLTITGQARGTWYFEASFPVEIRNAAGEVIAQHYAEAQSDWMTESFVPFRSTVSFPAQPAGSQGTVILRKDNPSGDPARDQSVSIPVVF